MRRRGQEALIEAGGVIHFYKVELDFKFFGGRKGQIVPEKARALDKCVTSRMSLKQPRRVS